MEERIIFLGGSPRSGTTLLQNMLDSHPDILGGPEFLHIPDIIKLRGQLQGSVSRGWISLICSSDEVDAQIRSLIESFLLPFADKHGAKFLSEKTPENVLVFSKLMALFPEARFIHVVRDPRAIVASLLSVGKKARQKGESPAPYAADVNAAISYVQKCLNAGFKATHLAPDRVYTVVYEHLVQNPEGEARKLCDFLGVEWVADMLKPGEKKHLGEVAITVNSKEIWYDAQTYNSNPNTASLDKWRTTLAPYQQLAVCRAFHHSDDLKQLGYDFSIGEISKVSRMSAALFCTLSDFRFRAGNKLRRFLR